jgi:hypothetical protein
MKRLLPALAVLALAGCGGSSGPTVAQRCHTYAVHRAQGAGATVQSVWEQLCNAHPKLLTVKP